MELPPASTTTSTRLKSSQLPLLRTLHRLTLPPRPISSNLTLREPSITSRLSPRVPLGPSTPLPPGPRLITTLLGTPLRPERAPPLRAALNRRQLELAARLELQRVLAHLVGLARHHPRLPLAALPPPRLLRVARGNQFGALARSLLLSLSALELCFSSRYPPNAKLFSFPLISTPACLPFFCLYPRHCHPPHSLFRT